MHFESNHIHTMIQYIRPSPFASISSLHLCSVGKNLPGVPSRDLNSGLPYSRPAHYQLSCAATVASVVNPEGFIPEAYPESRGRLGSLKPVEVKSSGSTAEIRYYTEPAHFCISCNIL
jgi:hypothetical protein